MTVLERRFECFTCDLGIGINSVRIRIIRAIKKTIFKLNSTTGDPEKLNFGNSLSADRFKSQSLDQSWSRSRTCAYQKRFQFGIGVILVLKNTILDTGTDQRYVFATEKQTFGLISAFFNKDLVSIFGFFESFDQVFIILNLKRLSKLDICYKL